MADIGFPIRVIIAFILFIFSGAFCDSACADQNPFASYTIGVVIGGLILRLLWV